MIEKRTPNRTAQIVIKLRPYQRADLEQAAKQQGVWMSEFARNAIVEACKEEVADE